MRRVSAGIVSGVLLLSACGGGGGGSSSGPKSFNDSIASDLSNLIVHDVSAGDHTVLHISADTDADFDLEIVVLVDTSYEAGSSTTRHAAAPPLDSFFTDASIDSSVSAGRKIFAVSKVNQHVKLAVPVVTKGSFRIVVGGDNGQGGAVTIHVDSQAVNGTDSDVLRTASESNKSS